MNDQKSPSTLSKNNLINYLEHIAHLMKCAEENVFKIRSFEKAGQAIAGLSAEFYDELLLQNQESQWMKVDGIGKGIAAVLKQKVESAHQGIESPLVAELQAALLPGLEVLSSVSGIGIKKAKILIQELEISTLAELEYACRENRLLEVKGFGQKLQKQILESLIQSQSHQQQLRLDEALPIGLEILEALRTKISSKDGHSLRIEMTGALRRKSEVIQQFEFLIQKTAQHHEENRQREFQHFAQELKSKYQFNIPIIFSFAEASEWGARWFDGSSSEEHRQQVMALLSEPEQQKWLKCSDESQIYKQIGMNVIPPESREGFYQIKESADRLSALVHRKQIKGVFHIHTNRSDGTGTLEEMVQKAESLGYDYIGISDHSQSAFYAHGLTSEILKQQKKEIDELQKRSKIRIFWGIESDILKNGSLDYSDSILEQFDFVIASIHSRFQMNREQMTERVLRALDSPYTKFLGHPTGRLILGRSGMDFDLDKILRHACDRQVVIELNANPQRLDIDWRHGPLIQSCHGKISINPDAHSVEGLEDVDYGVWMARKGLFTSDEVLNTLSLDQIERWMSS
jgi:DNA polymerase (family 10)